MSATPRRDFWSRLPLVGTLPERMQVIVELSKLLPPGQKAPLMVRATAVAYRARLLVYAVSIAFALAVGAGVVYGASKLVNSLSVTTEARGTSLPRSSGFSPDAKALAAIGSGAGLALDKVWLAEEGEGYEFYSNGARVLTEHRTNGHPRSFYRFTVDAVLNGSNQTELLSTPVGIVYHLSESDLIPFDDRYNSSLQVHSKSLIEYAREHRLYNYVIDRFGRTYLIVRDQDAASHAGNSIWSDGRNVFVNLSSSFIGICFEGKSGSGTGADGINEAQLYAARVLTAVLRSKYGISDANCVTHGLVSMNPSNKLMGYHTDWLEGFPFEALGLSSKYETEMFAISGFGFTYDQTYTARAGGKGWSGLIKADAVLREAAIKKGVTVEAERRSRWPAFQLAYSQQRALDKLSGEK
jgi:N-acetylmuramoyl-L-alanine amidase-like protein